MGRSDPEFLVVGHLNKPHGTKGEMFVWPLTDHPEGTYAPGVVVRLGEPDEDRPSPDLPPLRISAVRPFRRGYLVSFGGVSDRTGAERLRGRYLFRETAALQPLGEGEVFYHQLLDAEVVTVEGRQLGRVTEVYEVAPAHLLEVTHEDGQTLLPYLDHVVVEVDIEAGRIVVDPPEGLLDL